MPDEGRLGLNEDEVRQLKTLGWVLAVLNLLMVGIGLLIANALEEPARAGWLIFSGAF